MDGIRIRDSLNRWNQPRSKRQLLEAINADPARVMVECTSIMTGFSGRLDNLERGKSISFVGSCPHSNRKFYGTIRRLHDGSFKVE